VLNVWPAGAGPVATNCRSSSPAHTALKDRVRFVGVDLRDDDGPAREWLSYNGVGWPSLADPQGSIRGPLNVPGPPVTLFVNSAGQIVGVTMVSSRARPRSRTRLRSTSGLFLTRHRLRTKCPKGISGEQVDLPAWLAPLVDRAGSLGPADFIPLVPSQPQADARGAAVLLLFWRTPGAAPRVTSASC